MMNIQNPSFAQHQPQQPYGYGHAQAMGQPDGMAHLPADFNQSHFQQPTQFNTPQRPPQFNPQHQGQIPPHLYQQLQQQQHQLQQQQAANFARQQNQGQPRQSPNNPHSRSQSVVSQGNAPNTPSTQRHIPTSIPQIMNTNAAINPMQQSPASAQMGQVTNNAQQGMRNTNQQAGQQEAAKENERVTTLLQINMLLIEEVHNLQAQGKAGSTGQQSPTSPTADGANAGANSPSDGSKKTPPSQEYADCMRRLQANLAYLAAIADASKKASNSRPAGPAIMIPPAHLTAVHPLYQKLKALFPEASQTTLNKAMAVANAQAATARAAAAHPQQQAQVAG